MIRNLSLTLKDISESAAKARAAQQKSLDSLAKVVLNNRIALDYLLADQGSVCAALELTLLGKLILNYIRSLNKTLA